MPAPAARDDGDTSAPTVAELTAENAKLRRRIDSLNRSRSVRAARRLGELRRAGLRGVVGRLSRRELAVLAAAAFVGLLVVVGVAALLTVLTDNVGVAIGLTVIIAIVALAAVRGEFVRWRMSRRLRAIDNKLTTTQTKQFTALKRIAARTRAHQTLMTSLEKRFTTVIAAGVDTADAVVNISEDLRQAHPERVRKAVFNDTTKQYEQLQAAMNLFALVDVEAAVPPLRGWAVSPDALLVLLSELITSRPALYVECGSGSSTLWTALAIKKYGLPTRIVSLEHQAEYKEATEAMLERHGVAHLADVRLAPLVPTGIPEHSTPWYDVNAIGDVTGAGLVFIDGPPEASGPLARYPAVPLLLPHLDPKAVIVLDDAVRADEKTAVARWLAENPSLTTEYLRTEKGTSIVRRS